MYKPIRDYGLISNSVSAALVSRDGSIDWATLPYIYSPSVFSGILDDLEGGSFSIRPTTPFEAKHKYIENTNILITTFKTKTSVMELTDFIPISNKDCDPNNHTTTAYILRKVTCVSGECEFKVKFNPKFDYGRADTELLPHDDGIYAQSDNIKSHLYSHLEFKVDDNGIGNAVGNIKQGEHEIFIYQHNVSGKDVQEIIDFDTEFDQTVNYWEKWSMECALEKCNLSGPWENQVKRSSLVLRAN